MLGHNKHHLQGLAIEQVKSYDPFVIEAREHKYYTVYILFIDAWVTKTLDLKYSAGYKQHPAMLIIKVKTFITNLVYGPVSSWAYLIT